MLQKSRVIYKNETCCIEYFYSALNIQKQIACVFSAGGNKSLDGNNFGGDYLLKNSYDVIAVKVINDDWFQSIPLDVLDEINLLIDSNGYIKRIGTGNSMGGYAAIAFSKLLKLDVVVAYSPQYRIDQKFDKRWSDIALRIQWNYRINKDTISDTCQFFIIYDDKNLDGAHFLKLKELIPPINLQSLRISFCGHCAAVFLNETGYLKEITLSILSSGKLKDMNLRINKSLSTNYYINLHRELMHRGKTLAAKNVLDSAMKHHPSNEALRKVYESMKGHMNSNDAQHVVKKSVENAVGKSQAQHYRPIRLVVAFYKNQQLVHPLYQSLLNCVDELKKLKCQIYFYIDSPEDTDLVNAINYSVNSGALDVQVISNNQNLGFVMTVNQALEDAINCHNDVILLNSDTQIFPGCITELATVAYLDPMIGFVSPRSNNATICTLPHASETLDADAVEHFNRFLNISKFLPNYSYTPTAVGFCLFIKWNILSEFGSFDHKYGKGYNEENDLIMRANKSGFRAALANKAFVYHIGKASFGRQENSKTELYESNNKILQDIYPYYDKLIKNYYESPEYIAEKLLTPLSNINSLNICFDLSAFGPLHNGTIEAGLATLKAACTAWPNSIKLTVSITQEAWDYHALSEHPRLRRIEIDQPNEIFSAVIRYGQPFSNECISRALSRAPLVAFFMLDTIAADCGHLSIDLDENLWRFVMKWSDLIFTNSKFTEEQLTKRYILGDKSTILPVLHSIDPNDYRNREENKWSNSSLFVNIDLAKAVLIIGNHHSHKYLKETTAAVTSALTNTTFLVLGSNSNSHANVQSIESGNLSQQDIDFLYSNVSAIIFPSHYEGFGLPVMHALARRKPIYVRRLPPFEEISKDIIAGNENIHWYESTHSLIEQIKNGIAKWQGGDLVGEEGGWERSANQILESILQKMNHIEYSHLVDRMRWLKFSPLDSQKSHQLVALSEQYQAVIRHNNAIHSCLETVYSSNSWKITHPFRKIKDLYLYLKQM